MPMLAERLEQKNNELTQQIPDKLIEGLESCIQEIGERGILDQVIKEGQKMPSFELPDAQGNRIHSDDLVENGPLALHFYRGVW